MTEPVDFDTWRQAIRHHDDELTEIVEQLERGDLSYAELRESIVQLTEITRRDRNIIFEALWALCRQVGIWPVELLDDPRLDAAPEGTSDE